MKSHGSPTGLMGLRLMEGSPTSPTTLRVGLVGLPKLDLLCGSTNLYLATPSSAFVRLVKTPPKWGIMARCKQTFLVEQLTTERPGRCSRPGAGESQGRGAAVRPVDKKLRPAPNFTYSLTKDTKASEGSKATWTP